MPLARRRTFLFFAEIECELIDLCVVIDSSGSIRDNNPDGGSYDNWQLLLDFVKQVQSTLLLFFFKIFQYVNLSRNLGLHMRCTNVSLWLWFVSDPDCYKV